MRLPPGLIAVALLVVSSDRPSYAQGRMGSADSAAVARELAVWDAFQKEDSTAFYKLVGKFPPIIVSTGGIVRTPASELDESITTVVDRRKTQLDSAHVERVSADVVLLTYRLVWERRYKADYGPETVDTAWTTQTMYYMSVWARRGGRWQWVGLAGVPPTTPVEIPGSEQAELPQERRQGQRGGKR